MVARDGWNTDVQMWHHNLSPGPNLNLNSELILTGTSADLHICILPIATIAGHDTLLFPCTLALLVGQQEGHPACKKTEWWGAGMVICLEQGADLRTAQLMPLPLTVSCFNKIQFRFTFLVPAHLGSPGQRAIKRVCVCVFIRYLKLAENVQPKTQPD